MNGLPEGWAQIANLTGVGIIFVSFVYLLIRLSGSEKRLQERDDDQQRQLDAMRINSREAKQDQKVVTP